MKGFVSFVGAGPGDPELLTLKAVSRLETAQVVLFDDLAAGPILARARDARHAATLYRAGATTAVPQTLESSLQLSEAVLVDLGVAMGAVIASIHEKRDEHRQLIREEGELAAPPPLRSLSLRGRGPTGDGNPEPEPNV